jgi:hypothetical protein
MRRREAPKVESEQEKAKKRYDAMLKYILEPNFKTNATDKKREQGLKFITELRLTLKKIFPQNKFNLFLNPLGSVCLGIARKESDLDGIIYYAIYNQAGERDGKNSSFLESEAREIKAKKRSFLKTLFKRNIFQDLDFVDLNRVINFNQSQGISDMEVKPKTVLFGPRLDEFKNSKAKQVIDFYRKLFLKNLAKLGKEQAQKNWALVQDNFIIEYGVYGVFDNDDKKRRKVTEKVLASKAGRGSDRGKSLMDQHLQKVSLPGFKEMCIAFGVEPPN